MFFFVIALALAVSLTWAQNKEDCAKACDAKAAASKSCCMQKSKLASKTADAAPAKLVTVSDKKSDTKAAVKTVSDLHKCPAMQGAVVSGECTEAEKAHCDAMKAKMVQAGQKMDCCKDKAKTLKAEKKTSTEKAEAKGTD